MRWSVLRLFSEKLVGEISVMVYGCIDPNFNLTLFWYRQARDSQRQTEKHNRLTSGERDWSNWGQTGVSTSTGKAITGSLWYFVTSAVSSLSFLNFFPYCFKGSECQLLTDGHWLSAKYRCSFVYISALSYISGYLIFEVSV